MGFIFDSIGKKVSKSVLEHVETGALLAVNDHLERNYSVKSIMHKKSMKHKLIIRKNKISLGKKFYVRDIFETKKYCIKTDIINLGHKKIRIFDIEANEVGRVELKYNFLSNKIVYRIFLEDELLGTIRRKNSINSELDIDFNGWHVEGKIFKFDYKVYDEDENIVMIIHDAYEDTKTYVMEYDDKENELIGLLLVMSIELNIGK